MPHVQLPQPGNASFGNTALFVNDGCLSIDQVAPLRPTTLNTPIDVVRQRFHEDGYAFVKGFFPRAGVLKGRRRCFEHLSGRGMLAPGTDPIDGIFDHSQDKFDFPRIGAGGQNSNRRPIGSHSAVATKFVDLALQAHTEP